MGLIYAFFAQLQHALMMQEATRNHPNLVVAALKNVATYWMLVTVTGILIPGIWKRAVWTYGPLTCVLNMVCVYTRTCSPN